VVSPTNPASVAVAYHNTINSFGNFLATVVDGILRPPIAWNNIWFGIIDCDSNGDRIYGFNNASTAFQLNAFEASHPGVAYKINRTGLVSGFGTDIKNAGAAFIVRSGRSWIRQTYS
jgi:hypothetical protein